MCSQSCWHQSAACRHSSPCNRTFPAWLMHAESLSTFRLRTFSRAWLLPELDSRLWPVSSRPSSIFMTYTILKIRDWFTDGSIEVKNNKRELVAGRRFYTRLELDRWLLIMMIGVCIGFIAALLKQSIQALDALQWQQTKSYLKVQPTVALNVQRYSAGTWLLKYFHCFRWTLHVGMKLGYLWSFCRRLPFVCYVRPSDEFEFVCAEYNKNSNGTIKILFYYYYQPLFKGVIRCYSPQNVGLLLSMVTAERRITIEWVKPLNITEFDNLLKFKEYARITTYSWSHTAEI